MDVVITLAIVHGISTNIEDDEDVLKSPFPGTKGLQPEDDTFSAADATTDKQTVKGAIKGAITPDNLSDIADSATGINTAGCKSDTFESVYVQSLSCLLLLAE